jgi:hypothetical protein
MRLKKSVLTWLSALALAIAGTMGAAAPASANLAVTVIPNATSASVWWVNPVTFTGVNVDYKLHTASTWTSAVSNVVATSTVVHGLQPTTVYDFRVVAFNGATELENFVTTQTTLFVAACTPGTFSTTGYADTTCNPAPLGSYVSISGATSASQCAPGYYTDLTGQIACLPARAGKFVDHAGAITDVPCPIGRYSNSPGLASCTLAEIGYYVSQTGQITETICPAGLTTSSVGSASCDVIPRPAPSVTKLVFGAFKADTASSGTIVGDNLSGASSVTVGTAAATFGKVADESLAVTLPALKPGAYDLVIKFAGTGSYTIQSGIVIPQPEAPVVPAEVKVPAKPVTVTIGGFRTTATSLSTPQIAALSAGIAQAPAGCNVSATVVAYSPGGRAASSAAAARADQLNQILHAKFPGAQVSVSVVSSKALADARNVSVTFSPAN